MMSITNTVLRASICILAAVAVYKITNPSPRSFISEPLEAYDFIIVGGGSAGCVLASRLSEHYKVLLVEAGGKFGYLSKVPLAAPFLQDTEYDWKFRGQPQSNSSRGLVGHTSFWPRGKGLGGTGQINYLLHYTGRKEDWENWGRLGAEGWTSVTIAHYFAKLTGSRYRLEDFEFEVPLCKTDPLISCADRHCHINTTQVFTSANTCSLQPVRPITKSKISRLVRREKAKIVVKKEDPHINHLLSALIGSSQELRHLRLSVTAGESSVKGGQRWSSLQSHLLPVTNRPNLDILLQASVQKVTFSRAQGEAPEASGVVVEKDGKQWNVQARREVIVSAGAIGSPHLLQLSGVGPRQLLESHGIDVIADLPIGNNLHDQLNVPLFVSLTQPVSLTLSKVLKLSQVLKYFLLGKGSFASPGVAGIASTYSGNVGILLFGMGSTEEKLMRVISNYKQQVFNAMFPAHKNHSAEGFIFLVSCLQPASRGTVRIQTKDPNSPPLIDPNYLADPTDLACTRQGIKLAKRLVMTEPFKRLGAKLHLPVLDECYQYEVSVNDSDYLDCLIRTVGITSYHPGGTVSMGNHSEAVLDSSFRLNQLGKIRVVDSSTFPAPFSGTPHSALLAVAERAARMIEAEANFTTPYL